MNSDLAAMPQPSTHRPGTTGIAHRLRRVVLSALLLIGMVATALPASSAAASPSLKFDAVIGGCLWVGGPPSTTTNVTWRSASGGLKGRRSGSNGGMYMDCTSRVYVTSGDRITATAGAASRTFTMPVLTAAFDRVGYHVSGHGPVGSTLDITAWKAAWKPGPAKCTTTTRVHANGHYSVNVQGIPGGETCPPDYTPDAGDLVDVTWTSGHLDTVRRTVHAQQVVITQGGSLISGSVAPGRTVHIVVRTSAGALRGTAHGRADVGGLFVIVVRNSKGHSVHVQAGDHVSGDWAGNVALVVPDMRLQTIAILHQLTGWCMPHAPYSLEVRATTVWITWAGVTDANGKTEPRVSADDMITGASMTLTCTFHKGDQVTFSERVS